VRPQVVIAFVVFSYIYLVKHFLQILFIGSVLLVLLGLYNQQERLTSPDLQGNDLEQVLHSDGILAYNHQISAKISKIKGQDSAGQELVDLRKPHETNYSNHIRSEYKISLGIYSDIMRTLLHMKGLFPHLLSGKEILS